MANKFERKQKFVKSFSFYKAPVKPTPHYSPKTKPVKHTKAMRGK